MGEAWFQDGGTSEEQVPEPDFSLLSEAPSKQKGHERGHETCSKNWENRTRASVPATKENTVETVRSTAELNPSDPSGLTAWACFHPHFILPL